MTETRLNYKSIFLSDIHLGTAGCKIDEVNYFLEHSHCQKLVLNGDIIDGRKLARKGSWTEKHTQFIRLLLKKWLHSDMEVIYLCGNHDDILARFIPSHFNRFRILKEYIHKTPGGDYLVVHGDALDVVTRSHRWLALLGDMSYQILMKLNLIYSKYRSWRGKGYFSMSQWVKARVKSTISFIGNYEKQLQTLAERYGCYGIICGHIHTPEDRMVGKVHYLNSGDWVESLTALVEYEDGGFEVIEYQEFCRRLKQVGETV